MTQAVPPLTASQVNKAGRTLRRWLRGEIRDHTLIDGALDVVWRYRAAHAYPLTKATMGLRSVVRTEGCELEVSQRLKRMTTVLDKLVREPTMRLASMQDIGGCRAVLSTIRDVRRVEQRLKKNRPPIRYSDYISEPRESGYRAVHVVVGYGDELSVRRAIEVQLRTQVMHEWAITVERLSGRLRDDLKSGRGPEELLALLATVSEALNRRIADLRAAAVPFLRGTHG